MNAAGPGEAEITAVVANGRIGGGREVELDNIGVLDGDSSQNYGASLAATTRKVTEVGILVAMVRHVWEEVPAVTSTNGDADSYNT